MTEDTSVGSEATEEEIAAALPETPAEGTVPDPEDVTADPDPEEEEDPLEEYYRSRAALDEATVRERVRQELQEEYEARQAEEHRRALAQAEQKSLRDSFGDAVREAVSKLRSQKFYNEDGEQLQLTDQQLQEMVVAPFQKYNSTAAQVIHGGLLSTLAETALNSLPRDSREDFTKAAAGKPLDQWFQIYAEHAAKATKFVEQLKREEDVRIKAAEARALARAQKAKPTTPEGVTERPADTQRTDLTTQLGLARALREGKISDEEYRQQRRKLEGIA